MSLVHEFVAVWKLVNKIILYSEDIYEYINRGQIKKRISLGIPDDVVQKNLYDVHGKLLPNIKFNQWGISIYEKEDQLYWIDFLKSISGATEDKKYCHELLEFMMTSYFNNNIVLHFGI